MGARKEKDEGKWRLFHATDFVSLMQPCFFLSFIWGLFPYEIKSSVFIFSRSGNIYSTIITFFNATCLLIAMYRMDFLGVVGYDSVPGMLQGNFYYVLACTVSVLSYIFSRSRMMVLQSVLDVASRVSPKAYRNLSIFLHAKDLIGFLFLFGHVPNIYCNDINEMFVKCIGLYITIVVFLMDMLYINCVSVLKACLEKINENLLKLKEALITDEPHLLRRIYHEQWNPLLLLELRALKKCHLQIGDVINMLNTTFSPQIVITVVLTFAEVTFSLYFYILQREGRSAIDTNKQIWYSFFILPAIYYFIKLVILAWACETSKNQALQIGVNVHEVLINTTNQQIKDELQLFSLQILHRDNLFTAKGLSMDATVLTKVVGGISTYLLILIQFLYANGSCNKNASNDTIHAK